MSGNGQPSVAKRKVTSKIDYLPSSHISSTSATTASGTASRPPFRSSSSLATSSRLNDSYQTSSAPSLSYSTPIASSSTASATTTRARAKVNIANIATSSSSTPPLSSPSASTVGPSAHAGGYTASPLGNAGSSYAYFGDNGSDPANGGGSQVERIDGSSGSRREVAIGNGKASARRVVPEMTSRPPGTVRASTTPDLRRRGEDPRSSNSNISSSSIASGNIGSEPARNGRPGGMTRAPSSFTLKGRSDGGSTLDHHPTLPLPRLHARGPPDAPPTSSRVHIGPARSSDPTEFMTSGGGGDPHGGGLSISPSSSITSSLMSGIGRTRQSGRTTTSRAASPLPPDPQSSSSSVSPRFAHASVTARYSAGTGGGTTSSTFTPGQGSGGRPGTSLGSRTGSIHQDGHGSLSRTLESHEVDEFDHEGGGQLLTEAQWRSFDQMRMDEALRLETVVEREERERIEAEVEVTEGAKKGRKIADLEISNQSLMTVNRTLEAAAARKDRLISSLKRQLRASERGAGDYMDLAFKPLKERRSKHTPPEVDGGVGRGDSDSSEVETSDEEEGETLVSHHATVIDATLAKLNESLAAMAKRGREALDRVEATTEGEKGKVLGVLDLEEGDEVGEVAAAAEDGSGAVTPDAKESGQFV